MTKVSEAEATHESVQELLRDFRSVLDARIQTEARSARRGRRVGWIALFLALVAAVSTSGLLYYAFYRDLPLLTSPSVRAEEIVLVDAQGVERGSWTVDPEGTARLVFKDPSGVDRLKLTLKADGEQGISLADASGGARVVLGYLADQSGTLAFADQAGTTRTVLGMSASEASSLLFADRNGGARAALGLTPTGEPTFWWPEADDPASDTGAP